MPDNKVKILPDKILIIDDQPSVRFGLRNLLEAEGYRVLEAETGAQALAVITEQAPQLILLDLRLPDTDGLTLLPQIRAIDDEAPIIVLTAHGTIETAIRALKAGAENFLTKPFDADSLLILIARTLEQSRARRERLLIGLAQQQFAAEYFMGQSAAIQRLHATLERLAVSDTTVLLQGETGTGKGMVAHLIHRLSDRRDKPFVTINCAGLNRELLESELFGHEKGAFTSAVTSKAGLFELAHAGTIFFDEIAEMEPSIQARVLTVMEQKRFRRVGGVQEKEVNVRIIAASNRHLPAEIKRGRFREDLFYRLSVMPLALPGLRERRADILPFIAHFIAHFNQRLNRRVSGVTPKAEALLLGYHWPGNIRELRNVIERAMILCGGDLIHASDLPLGDQQNLTVAPAADGEQFLSLEELERLHIERIFSATGGNLSRAAELLGITRNTLYSKLRKYNLTAS
ncbi:MAG: sigma-54-dependent Fis family transcriptional regulator [Acidobacteria bacterium]|nr:sigma-54-dependent Fis family transcriptional regulator [Acidobacteriota bacterium]MBI3422530.1 sigma-54-dependent Fis family transcriptional regulator [Acidobacteriota bacterium]